MSNIKEVHDKPRLYVAGHYYLDYGRHVARLRRRRRAYAPTSNTASQNNHKKINSWVSFAFLYVFEYGAPLGGPSGRRSSAKNFFEISTKREAAAIVLVGLISKPANFATRWLLLLDP